MSFWAGKIRVSKVRTASSRRTSRSATVPTLPVVSAAFDEPNLVSAAGLVQSMVLAERASLCQLGDEHLRPDGHGREHPYIGGSTLPAPHRRARPVTTAASTNSARTPAATTTVASAAPLPPACSTQASRDATDRSVALLNGLLKLGFDAGRFLRHRQPTTEPPGSFLDQTPTGRRRRASQQKISFTP